MQRKRRKLADRGADGERDLSAEGAQVSLPCELWVMIFRMALAPDPFETVPHTLMPDEQEQARINSHARMALRRSIRLTCKLFLRAHDTLHRRVHVSDISDSGGVAAAAVDCKQHRKPIKAPSLAALRKTGATSLTRITPNFLLTAPMRSFVQERVSGVSLVLKTQANIDKLASALDACATRARDAPALRYLAISAIGTAIHTGDICFKTLVQPFAQLDTLELGVKFARGDTIDMTWLATHLPLLQRLTLDQEDYPDRHGFNNDPQSYFCALWPSTLCSTRFKHLTLRRCDLLPEFIFSKACAPSMKTLRVVAACRGPNGLNLTHEKLSLLTALEMLELRHLTLACSNLAINSALPNLRRLVLQNIGMATGRGTLGSEFFFDGPCAKLVSLFIDQTRGWAILPGKVNASFFPALESLCATSCAYSLFGGTVIDTRAMHTLRFLDITRSYDHSMWKWKWKPKRPIVPPSVEVLCIATMCIGNSLIQCINLSHLTRLLRLSIRHDRYQRTNVIGPSRCAHIEWIEDDTDSCAEKDAALMRSFLPRDKQTLQTVTIIYTRNTARRCNDESKRAFRAMLDDAGCAHVRVAYVGDVE